jgi:hypothetical protein
VPGTISTAVRWWEHKDYHFTLSQAKVKNAVVPPLPLHALVACTGTSLLIIHCTTLIAHTHGPCGQELHFSVLILLPLNSSHADGNKEPCNVALLTRTTLANHTNENQPCTLLLGQAKYL